MLAKGNNQLNLSNAEMKFTTKELKTIARKEKQEGPTYQSNVGLKLEQSALAVTTESVDVINHIIQENIPEETVAAYEKSVSAYVTRPNLHKYRIQL